MDEAAINVQLAGHEVLHICSGPDRPGSYRRWMQSLGGACHDYDILVDPSCNLLDSAAWSVLSTDVESQRYHGMQADPVCTTFSAIRGKAGGPPPVRGLGKDLYGYRDLAPALKLQVEQDTLLAERVAWMAVAFHTLGRPFVTCFFWRLFSAYVAFLVFFVAASCSVPLARCQRKGPRSSTFSFTFLHGAFVHDALTVTVGFVTWMTAPGAGRVTRF